MSNNVDYSDDSYLSYFKPVQVVVEGDDATKAISLFRSLVTKERIMSVLKEHYSYEKPSERRRRKHRETMQRIRKAERDSK